VSEDNYILRVSDAKDESEEEGKERLYSEKEIALHVHSDLNEVNVSLSRAAAHM
jgi:hypothetical protein